MFGQDIISPVLVSYSVDLNVDTLSLTFDEAVRANTVRLYGCRGTKGFRGTRGYEGYEAVPGYERVREGSGV